MLAAILIVLDEEHFLPGCLSSLEGLVDEIVVVDTGSTDRSREIARSFGCKVIDFAWCDDFSAARNAAIDHASQGWMLYIDADERVRPADSHAIRQELDAPDLLAATVRFRPRTGCTDYREHRLLRRDPRIRFHGAMHEGYYADARRLVDAGVGRIGTSRLALDHLGYDGDQSHKLARNLRLLRKQILADPARVYLRWHLGSVLRDLGDPEAAEAAWVEGAALARQAGTRSGEAALCATELGWLAFTQGRDPAPAIAEGLALHPGNWSLLWLKGKHRLDMGDADGARPILEALASVDPDALVDEVAYDRRIFGAVPLAELAEDAFRRRDYAGSADLFARALHLAPDRLEYAVKERLARSRL